MDLFISEHFKGKLMGKELNIFNILHTRTSRKYIQRMQDDKIQCMQKARKFDFNFWDGDRKFGYGGYKYDGRWKIVAEKLIEQYSLTNTSKVLDVGCGKGFLLYELKLLLPNITVKGFDISEYSIENTEVDIKNDLFIHKAQETYPFEDKEFDLVISLNTLHNLKVFELKKALQECQRVAQNGYIVVEGYRDEKELFNLQCWALTCESFFRPDEWTWMYEEWGYTGDYEFIYFD